MQRKTALLVLAGLLSGTSPAWADGCDNVTAALVRMKHTPYHTVTTVDAGAGFTLEEFFTGDAIYLRRAGNPWKVKSTSGAQLEADYRNSLAGALRSCTPKGSDKNAGDVADITAMHTQLAGLVTDTQYWISRKTGLPLKQASAMLFNGTLIHIAITYDYKNVKAPAH